MGYRSGSHRDLRGTPLCLDVVGSWGVASAEKLRCGLIRGSRGNLGARSGSPCRPTVIYCPGAVIQAAASREDKNHRSRLSGSKRTAGAESMEVEGNP
ncbi:hypothetical protein BGX38DRAFT_295973 [Terfezia claveryi]|nr:hypothetical protein BGX38DRAFT_295973 [Terfezia claveryi]